VGKDFDEKGARAVSNHKLLSIYLSDHLAGANAGRELARRCLSNNRGNALGDFLQRVLLPEIESDKGALESLMDDLQAPRSRLKHGAAWAAEKVGRLKLNGQLRGYSPLSRLLELEGLCLGVEGKLSMWRALQRISASFPQLQARDLGALIERAQAQRAQLEEHRLAAADAALRTNA
jgi:hypothetical protein